MISLPNLTDLQVKNFWKKVQKAGDDECWVWKGKLNHGFGRFSVNMQECLAHRLAYYLSTGTDLKNTFVFHTCGNKACCNPKHLDLRRPPRKTKLTPAQVKNIREEKASLRELAKKYGVNKSTIQDIITRKTWKNI